MIHYVVPGETLYSIAQEILGNGNEWPIVWEANRATVDNPNLIYPGEQVYVPKHAAPATDAVDNDGDNDSDDSPAYVPQHSSNAVVASSVSGTLSCSGLESLWDNNDGNPSDAFVAAEIAMAESSGQQFATGPYGERGYWQINPNHGSLSTYDANGNARAAIELSGNGTNWSPWTTYNDGAYQGQC